MEQSLPAGAPSPTPPRGLRGLQSRILDGLSEAVAVTGPPHEGAGDRIVHAVNPAARRLLPGLVVGTSVTDCGEDAFAAAVAQDRPGFEAGVAGTVALPTSAPVREACTPEGAA